MKKKRKLTAEKLASIQRRALLRSSVQCFDPYELFSLPKVKLQSVLIAQDIFKIQPMMNPSGLVFYIEFAKK